MRALRTALVFALLAAAPAAAQDEKWRQVLSGENATIVFGPNGGYARENYLKRFKSAAGQDVWATQNGVLAELIRRTTPGGKVRLAAFRLDEADVLNACFEVAKSKNVEVKLWLKGPPGLDYMVAGHEALAERANQYLRERAAQNKQAEWGDFQVMIGTAAKMSAFGKVNDMHEKFGIVDLTANHVAGRNHGFLGTSNIGASSDRSHNESRLFFNGNPHAAQRLWGEFDRLWKNLGDCRTFKDGDQSKGVNLTPEGDARIRVGNGFADEKAAEGLSFRFTYERDPNGQFHRITPDFVAAIGEATQLPAGSVVSCAQFGFQISQITEAFVRAAKAAPQVEFRIMVHMAEAETSDVRRLVEAKLPNLKVAAKWDSNKLVLENGSRPQIPDVNNPGPPLLHHKTLLVGDRVMVTGSFNFFGDADAQGEQIVIIRNNVASTYSRVLADTRAEFEALWRSQVLLDAAKIDGPDGLMETIEKLSGEDGFLEALNAVGQDGKTAEQVRSNLGQGAPSLDTVKGWLDTLAKFGFLAKDQSGRYSKVDPDLAAHAPKDGVRARALTNGPAPVVVDPVTPVDPPVDPVDPVVPTEGALTGKVLLEGSAVRLVVGAVTWKVKGTTALLATLRQLSGREVTLFGTQTAAMSDLAASRLVAPTRSQVRASVVSGQGGVRIKIDGGAPLPVTGPAAGVLSRAIGRDVTIDGYAYADGVVALAVEATVTRRGPLTRTAWGALLVNIPKNEKVWVSKIHTSGELANATWDGQTGWFQTSRLAFGTQTAGLVNSIPGQ